MGRRSLGGVVVVGIVATAITSLFAVRVLGDAHGDPTIFTAFGEEATVTRAYAEVRLGEVQLRAQQGHDGKFFFVQSNDPWILDPEENALILDRPLYRSQRMFYPVLAGGGGLFSPEVIVWAMLIVNVVAMGVGSIATAQIAVEMGGSPWWGLAFALNLGFVSEMNIGGAGIVSAAAAFGAVALLLKGKRGWAFALLLFAALSREAMIIAAAGSAWWLWKKKEERRNAALALAIPLAGIAAWAIYLRMRIGWNAGVSEVQEIGLPFVGFIEAFSSWLGDPIDLVVGVTMLLLFALFTRRVFRSDHLVGWAFVGFVLLGVLFTKQVWMSYFDITRAVAPIISAFVLLVFLGDREPSPERTGVRP